MSKVVALRGREKAAPDNILRKVPARPKNRDVRSREHLLPGFRSIWQRKMRSAIEAGVLKERFRDHDIRAKAASDADAQHAIELMGHDDGRITDRHYRRKPKIVRPLR